MQDRIFEYLIDNDCIEIETLERLGCYYGEVNVLIQRGILSFISLGVYRISNVENLYEYGNKLIANGKYERANQCFLRCYKICPKHLNTCLRLFTNFIIQKKYTEALKYFDTIFENENIDAKLYLQLLSNITSLPEKYKSYVLLFGKYIDKDYMDCDKRNPEKYSLHKMKLSIYKGKFSSAFVHFNDMIRTRRNGNIKIEEFPIRILLVQIIEIEKTLELSLLECENEKEYEKMFELLVEKRDKYHLKETEGYWLKLVEVVLQITKNKTLPNYNPIITNNDYEAIDNGDYELALRLSDEFHDKNNIDSGENLLNLLLKDIVNLINKLNKSNEQSKSNVFNKDEQSGLEINEIVQMVVYNKCHFNDACKLLNLNCNLILLAKMHIAIEYYRNSDNGIADRMLQEVEKSPDKTPEVKKLLLDTKSRKKFLKYEKKY